MAAFGNGNQAMTDLLKEVDLFSACTRKELRQLQSLMSMTKARSGQVLAKKGSLGREFFVIVDGEATATCSGERVAKLERGSFFGELALLDGGPRTATVTAVTDMRLLVLTRREFQELITSQPSIVIKMLVELGGRLRRTDEMFERALPAI